MQPKRFLIPLLVVILVTVSALSFTASAAFDNSSLGIAVEAKSETAVLGEDGLVAVKPLDVVAISVTAGAWVESSGIGSITVKIEYDSSMVEYVSATSALYGNFQPTTYRPGIVTFTFLDGHTGYGELLNASFKIKEGVHSESLLEITKLNVVSKNGWVDVPYTLTGEDTYTLSCHKYSDGVVTEPTCMAEGYTTYTCTECGESVKGNYTEKVDHKAGAAATCTTDQVCIYGCGTVMTPKLGHDVTASCGDQTCPRCNETVPGTLEHTYGDWVIEREPTKKEDGSKYKVCSVCSHKVVEAIPYEGGFPWWIIVIIAVVVLGGGGFCYYWFFIKKKKDQENEVA